ncbi:unnamed protein product [Rotaria magnacalcarata]|uniref:Uncharacterized protein n=3 Tax=Rotaria magnacalcarata TaxID=392030 RepID=A0A816H1W6_9BILA|nr:unnamed protein product [Rotaria magnacalcarata]CAF1680313.1 unnamed protein product [Rotaria magnacalcarata]CAF1948972.1 unnamed protein product [Rotaria magnacalcarata]
MIRIQLNFLKRLMVPITQRPPLVKASSFVSDDTLRHLLSSNESNLSSVKFIRDAYERLLEEKSLSYGLMQTLYANEMNQNHVINRELMYYKGVLHSRGLVEEFRGYLRGMLQGKSVTPMSTQKLYAKMIDLAFHPTPMTTPMLTPMVLDMLSCFGLKLDNASDVDKKNLSDKLVHELDHLYGSLSESIHAKRMPRHSREFVICSKQLTNEQVCLIKCIARHYLCLDESEIRIIDS